MGIIRRRIVEMYDKDINCIDIEEKLERERWVNMQGTPKNRVVLISGIDAEFIDPQDPNDMYTAELWQALSCLLDELGKQGVVWQGGRYSCAQKLRAALPNLQEYTLGQAIHVVQLAIRRKLLGYVAGGAVAPYVLSDLAKKDRLAAHRATPSSPLSPPALSTWHELRKVVVSILQEDVSGRGINLSEVKERAEKRGFLLCETLFGESRLVDVFRHPKMQSVCAVKPRRVRGKEEVPYLVPAEQLANVPPAPPSPVAAPAPPTPTYAVDKVSVDVVGTFLSVRENTSCRAAVRRASVPRTMFANDRTEAKSFACRFVNRIASSTPTTPISATTSTVASTPKVDPSGEKASLKTALESVPLAPPEDACASTTGVARAA
jgi:hypothetical protein